MAWGAVSWPREEAVDKHWTGVCEMWVPTAARVIHEGLGVYPQVLQEVAHTGRSRRRPRTVRSRAHNLLNLLFIRKNVGFFQVVA